MNLHDPSNRLGKPVQWAEDAEDFTIEGAKVASRNCPRCSGEGLATIFSPTYDGNPVRINVDSWGQSRTLMRTVAFCICPAGRKVAVMNQQSAKDFFLRVPDLHDVIAGRYCDWVADDPRPELNEPFDLETLKPEVKRLAKAMRRLSIYQPEPEPEETPRDEINREFDEPDERPENLAAS